MSESQPWIERLLSGELDAAEREQLKTRLREDPDFRRTCGAHLSLEGMIGPAMEDELGRERHVERVMQQIEAADREFFVDQVRSKVGRSRRRRVLPWAAAVAACVAVGSAIFMSRPEGVATVTRTESVASGMGPELGTVLRAGEPLVFHAGLVELDLKGRGRMILEGPVEVEWTDEMTASLKRGRLHMRVNEAGRGYEVKTPGGRIIDLGTEFGVVVDPQTGETETHVLDGEVEAVPTGAARVELRKNDALRFGPGVEERMAADPGRFYSSLPEVSEEEPPFIRWSMDLVDGGRSRSESRGIRGGEHDFVGQALTQGHVPEAVEGVRGGAVGFDGRGACMRSDYEGVAGSMPRTVTLWVKIPEDLGLTESLAIISWGRHSHERPGGVWQVSINPWETDGPVGRVRVGAHGGRTIGTRDLRDGRWHHLAVVLYPAARPDVGKHVMIYIDGELEPLSQRTFGPIDTRADEAVGVWLARDITTVTSGDSQRSGRSFRGAIDEVSIHEGVLSQERIREIMRQEH